MRDNVERTRRRPHAISHPMSSRGAAFRGALIDGASRASLDSLTVRAYPRGRMVKPGYKTTEFWATVAVVVPLLLNEENVHKFLSTWHGGVLLAVVTAAYAVSRGLAKRPG